MYFVFSCGIKCELDETKRHIGRNKYSSDEAVRVTVHIFFSFILLPALIPQTSHHFDHDKNLIVYIDYLCYIFYVWICTSRV